MIVARTIEVFVAAMLRRRAGILFVIASLTVVAATMLPGLRLDTGFLKSIPAHHPLMQVYDQYAAQFGSGNRLLIALHEKHGDIFQPSFFRMLETATKEVFFLSGVDKAKVTSLFTPNVRFTEVVQGGFTGGTVIPADFTASDAMLVQVRRNIRKSPQARTLVSADHKTALIRAELLELDPASGKRLNYPDVARQLNGLRQRFESENVSVHIIGFAPFIGEIHDGLKTVMEFFVLTVLLSGVFLRLVTKTVVLALALLGSSLVAVVWLLGLLAWFDIAMHPFGILVPFLVFAIGISHGLQMVFVWRKEFAHRLDGMQAATGGLQKLLVPGIVALLSDCVGFLTILQIDIGVIKDTAVSASVGIALLIITNLVFLPVLLSYCQAPPKGPSAGSRIKKLWRILSSIAAWHNAVLVVGVSFVVFVAAFQKAVQLPIGDLQQGRPELRESSRYNRDVRFISEQFHLSMDLLTVYGQTHADGCIDYDIMRRIDDFGWRMQQLHAVLAVASLPQVAKINNSGWHEGNLKWRTLPRQPAALGEAVSPVETASGLLNHDCSVMPVYIYLADHRADTLTHMVQSAQQSINDINSDRLHFALAGGNAAIIAATNDVIAKAQLPIIVSVFAAIVILCLISFRSVTAALSIVTPLAVVSVLTYALMAILHIGLKVSTLPIVALSAGIGVDYAIYLYAHLQTTLAARSTLDHGLSISFNNNFQNAYTESLQSAGKAVFYTAVILSIGVVSWVFSPLKYQADMGLLLTFSFIVNMLAALLLMPAIAVLLIRRSVTDFNQSRRQ